MQLIDRGEAVLGALVETAARHGVKLNFGPDKTAALLVFAGPGARSQGPQRLAAQGGNLHPRGDQTLAACPVVDTY
eukprot:9779471-Lingulodinium_polyedra.AAC.1